MTWNLMVSLDAALRFFCGPVFFIFLIRLLWRSKP